MDSNIFEYRKHILEYQKLMNEEIESALLFSIRNRLIQEIKINSNYSFNFKHIIPESKRPIICYRIIKDKKDIIPLVNDDLWKMQLLLRKINANYFIISKLSTESKILGSEQSIFFYNFIIKKNGDS